jgi:hypothetical protein
MICLVATIPFLHIITLTNSIHFCARGVEWWLTDRPNFYMHSYISIIVLFHRQLTLLTCLHRLLSLLCVLFYIFILFCLVYMESLILFATTLGTLVDNHIVVF